MVTIHRFSPYGVEINGHAGAGAYGSDLVCAAVSALTLTAGANVAGLQAEKLLEGYEICLDSGKSHVSCAPKKEIAPAAEMIFDTICQGFALLSQLYPNHIELIM